MGTRRQWNDIFNVLKENKSLPKILYSEKLSFKNEEMKALLTNENRDFCH